MRHPECEIENYFEDANDTNWHRKEHCLKCCSLYCLIPNSLLSLNERMSLPHYLFVATSEYLEEMGNNPIESGVEDVINAGYTLSPLKCKYCGSFEVSFHQYIGDAYCANCGKWQLEEMGNNSIESGGKNG